MKFLVMFSLTLGAASAMACPNLNGTYQCEKDANDPSDSGIITVQGANGFYVYTDKEDPGNPSMMPADGKTYQTQDGGTYVGTCTDTTFDQVVSGTDAEYGPFVIKQAVSLDANTNLSQKGVINVNFGEGQKDYAFSSNCTRL